MCNDSGIIKFNFKPHAKYDEGETKREKSYLIGSKLVNSPE